MNSSDRSETRFKAKSPITQATWSDEAGRIFRPLETAGAYKGFRHCDLVTGGTPVEELTKRSGKRRDGSTTTPCETGWGKGWEAAMRCRLGKFARVLPCGRRSSPRRKRIFGWGHICLASAAGKKRRGRWRAGCTRISGLSGDGPHHGTSRALQQAMTFGSG